MQVPGNYPQSNVLATTRISPFKSVSPRRNGGRVRDQGHPHWQTSISPPPAPRAPALHPLVYAQQLGWSGITNTGDNARIQSQTQGAYGQVHPTSVSPPAFPPVPPLATTTPTYPFGSFPYYGGNFLGPQPPQLHPQAATSVMRQQDLAAYPTQFFHPQAAYQHQLLVPVLVQSQSPSPTTTRPTQPTTGAPEHKDPFVYVQPPSDALNTERGRELYRRPPKTRIRVAQACEPCRRRKSKCTGAKPKCKRCDKKNLECVYIEDHRANRLRGMRSRMVASVPVTELDEDYDGDSTLPPCPPARPSYSSSSAYSCSSGYSSGSLLDSALPPPSSRSSTSETPSLPYPIYSPPRIRPLAGLSLIPQSGTGANGSAQNPSGVDSSTAISRALDFTDAQTAVSTQPTATGSGLMPYQHNALHPQQVPSCVPDHLNLGSQQAQNMNTQPSSCLPPPRGISGMSTPRSTPLTQDMHHASINPSRGLGQRLAAVAKEMEVPLLFAPPPPLGRDRSSSSPSHPQGARSGAQTPTDYFSIPLTAASRSSSGNSHAQQVAQMVQGVPPPMQPTKSDGVASGLAQMNLESMASGGIPLPGSLVSAMSGQDWEGGYGLEYEDWFHSFAGGLPDSLPSGGDLSFYR
ncbi:transcription factor [Ganoderma sinense ZZ0214-1]|uniref:Transcription factor n=1 Tax=Ganoderma sinense ZZ0214-1 TaxID=1077348 RepID=A0A2G8RRZ6_9APHY|nr:transcription factor [Ganoderma sinense ZZ0214-1]